MSERVQIAEGPSTRLLCDGRDHWTQDKRTEATFRLCACDCAKAGRVIQRGSDHEG